LSTFMTDLAAAAVEIAGYVTTALGAALSIGVVFLGGRYAWKAFKSIR